MSIDHYPKPEVGMEVFIKWSGRHHITGIAIITKIGRKWATLNQCNGRFDISTWRLDGGDYGSPGTCYPSEQEYNDQQAVIAAWTEFRRKAQHLLMPSSVTVEKIKQASELLGITLDEGK